MSTDRTYRCDLCNQMLGHGRNGIGIHFKTVSKGADNIKETGLRESEHHLCLECIQGLKPIVTRVRTGPL